MEAFTRDSYNNWCLPVSLLLLLHYTGLTAPTGQCDGGFYCTGGAILQNPSSLVYGDICPVGHYCPAGTSSPEPCPAGTYLSTEGASASGDCVFCPSGRYCASTGLSNYTGNLATQTNHTYTFTNLITTLNKNCC